MATPPRFNSTAATRPELPLERNVARPGIGNAFPGAFSDRCETAEQHLAAGAKRFAVLCSPAEADV